MSTQMAGETEVGITQEVRGDKKREGEIESMIKSQKIINILGYFFSRRKDPCN
jgi:hypothetical protein